MADTPTTAQAREALEELYRSAMGCRFLPSGTVETLRAYLALAEKAVEDAERLDWIGRQYLEDVSMRLVFDAPHDGEYCFAGTYHEGYGKTLREAIDAAMKQDPTPTREAD